MLNPTLLEKAALAWAFEGLAVLSCYFSSRACFAFAFVAAEAVPTLDAAAYE